MSSSTKQTVVAAAARARSASLDLNDIAKELDNIASTLPTTKDRALFKATTVSKPLRYVKSQSSPLPALNKKEKQGELNCITAASLNITNFDDPKKVQCVVTLSKILQCLLWDFDFRFILLPHQIEGVFAVAGIAVSTLLKKMKTWSKSDLDLLIKLDVQKEEGKKARRTFCKHHVEFVKTKGLLLADVMGLGKTVESIAACVLRNGIMSIKGDSNNDDLPTLIIGPNEAVLNQWEDNLIMSGIKAQNIKYFYPEDKIILKEKGYFILMTRYAVMHEVRNVFNGGNSFIFSNQPQTTMKQLSECMVGIYKESGNGRKTELISQVLSSNTNQVTEKCFRTLIIDESHMMKNLSTYWSIGVGLLSATCERNIPISGTPFIHGYQDMATLMVFIDPTKPFASKTWWKKAVIDGGTVTAKYVHEWRINYFVRREKSVLAKDLPAKLISLKNIGSFGVELGLYKEHEDRFLDALTAFFKLPREQEDKRDLVNFLFAQLTCMRMSLIHPLLTKGREFTIKFSPSRRNMQVQLSNGPKLCVCCNMGPGDALGSDGKPAKIVPLPSSFCFTTTPECPHYAHETCADLLLSDVNASCPRCKDFCQLAHIDPKLVYKIPHPVYSKKVKISNSVHGFKSTAKLENVLTWVKNIPQEDKAIIYSFFEGCLDILEGILVENLQIECARFDDDVDTYNQAKELSIFKKSPTCRVLLATVQSSGTGLNIEEANHIAFIDRCFDTYVHRQAEDRCHNLRQKKEVEVTYFDGSMTVDEIMKALNEVNSSNDTVILADGTSIGKKEPTIKYGDLSGVINTMMKMISDERKEELNKHPDNALEPSKLDLVKVINEKENINDTVANEEMMTTPTLNLNVLNTPQDVNPPVAVNLADRRVSFASTQNKHEPHTATPRASLKAPHMTTFIPYNGLPQQTSPFVNYSPYHGYGIPTSYYPAGFVKGNLTSTITPPRKRTFHGAQMD